MRLLQTACRLVCADVFVELDRLLGELNVSIAPSLLVEYLFVKTAVQQTGPNLDGARVWAELEFKCNRIGSIGVQARIGPNRHGFPEWRRGVSARTLEQLAVQLARLSRVI